MLLDPQKADRRFETFSWGFIPSWSKDGRAVINARSETVAEKPFFRDAFKKRRCLIPAIAFYEWQKQAGGKQPYAMAMKDDSPFAFAGLWEGNTAAILTTEPNKLMQPIHNRMPVILQTKDYEPWLDTDLKELKNLTDLFAPYPTSRMKAYPVSTFVNKPANDSPQCLVPI